MINLSVDGKKEMDMKKRIVVLMLAVLLVLTACGSKDSKQVGKESIVVVTDGSESAKNALIRLSLYANEFDIKGIYNVDSSNDFKAWYDEYALAYESVADKLIEFDSAYPKSIKELYHEDELELLLTDASTSILNWTNFDYDGIDITEHKLLSSVKTEVKAKEVRDFSVYENVFGAKWPSQDAVYRKSLSTSWIKEKLSDVNSPLFVFYSLNKDEFIGELESLTFLSILNNGLNPMDDVTHGSWGGRLVGAEGVYNQAGEDYNEIENKMDANYSLQRFIDAFQLDFANRLNATVGEAVKLPVVSLDQKNLIEAKANETVIIKASLEDEADKAYFKWVRYEEADSYEGEVVLDGWGSSSLSFKVPEDAQTGDTIHVVLEVEEASSQLKTYQRVIVTVK